MSQEILSQLDTVLALCPGCGGDSTRVIGGPGTAGGPKFWVGCDYCRWRTWGDTEADAITTWNKRAAVGGEAVAVAWRSKDYQPWLNGGFAWAFTTDPASIRPDHEPLYTSPPATVDTVALRELVEKWRREANGWANASSAYVTSTARGYTLAADELAALIGEDKP